MLNSSLETTNKLTPTFTIPAFKALPDVHNEHSIIFFLHLHSSLQASSNSGGAHSTQSFRFSATVCKKKKNLQQRSQTQRKEKKKKHKNILMTTYNWQFKPQHFTRQAGTELCSENNRPGPDMSDGVERTKRVRGENNASIHQVQLHGRDIKLRQRDELSGSGSGIVSVFLFFLLKFFFYFFFPPSLGRDSPLPITTISDEDMRKIKESKK